jgi:glycosyltransferase involved in cell wall biosynthesis
MLDVLIVSLGATGGLRAADDELLASIGRAGARAALARPDPPPRTPTMMLTDLRWALAARRAAGAEVRRTRPRAVIYSTTTAALLWPTPGAVRFDASAADNRRGRHGLWQRPLERRRLREAPLLLPWSDGALGGIESAGGAHADARALVLPVPVDSAADHHPGVAPGAGDAGTPAARDIAAFTYASNPLKKGLDRVLEAWRRARRPGEELVVAGVPEGRLRELGYAVPAEGVRVVAMLPHRDYRALLRRARVFVCGARREDYGIAQLEALAEGCMLVTVPSPGPYAALPIARELDGRLVGEELDGQLVGEELARALRTALDDPAPGYAERALRALVPYRRAAADRLVAEELLPRLLGPAV